MTIVTSLPDNVRPVAGEEIEFAAVVQSDGSFQVTRIMSRHPVSPRAPVPRMRIMDWVAKWGGTMELTPGETRESLRDSYLSAKFDRKPDFP